MAFCATPQVDQNSAESSRLADSLSTIRTATSTSTQTDHGYALAVPLSYLEREIHDFQKYLVAKLCAEKAGAAKVAAE